MFKNIRIFILLLILVGVAVGSWKTKSKSVEWKYDLPVNIYLINGDGSEITAAYLKGITVADFKPVETFMKEEARRYARDKTASIELRLGGLLVSAPPEPPLHGSAIEIIFWSMRMRWWAFRHTNIKGANPQVRLFLIYFDPARTPRLGHSTGLQKGLLGRVNVFAARDMASQNNVVIAHEFLHTLGATDKYDAATNQPLFPQGYALPEQIPLYPQKYAEIMAGRTPVNSNTSEIPAGLNDVVIGEKTAREINWQ
ncbi:MAG: hypothetical protein ACOH1I_05945 [Gallionellaceae bacterium]|jgi:hypothetical protein